MIFDHRLDPICKNCICMTEKIKNISSHSFYININKVKIYDDVPKLKAFKKMVRQRGFEPPHP
jgi:hypothetical protein